MSQQTWEVYTGATAPGSTTVPNIKNALRAAMNCHAGTTAQSYAEEGHLFWDTADDTLEAYDGAAWHDVAVGSADFLPTTDDDIDLGSASKRFAEIHGALAIADGLQTNDITDKAGTGAPGFSQGLETTGDILPAADNTQDLGSGALRFAEIHAAIAIADALQADTITDKAGTGPPDATYGLELSPVSPSNASSGHGKILFSSANSWIYFYTDSGVANLRAGAFYGSASRCSLVEDYAGTGPPDATYGMDFSTASPGNPAAGHGRVKFDGTDFIAINSAGQTVNLTNGAWA